LPELLGESGSEAVSGIYFYEQRSLVCPACLVRLKWEQRFVFASFADRMILVHPAEDSKLEIVAPPEIKIAKPCPYAGKKFYAPAVECEELKDA
jgi:hypothetical protein